MPQVAAFAAQGIVFHPFLFFLAPTHIILPVCHFQKILPRLGIKIQHCPVPLWSDVEMVVRPGVAHARQGLFHRILVDKFKTEGGVFNPSGNKFLKSEVRGVPLVGLIGGIGFDFQADNVGNGIEKFDHFLNLRNFPFEHGG